MSDSPTLTPQHVQPWPASVINLTWTFSRSPNHISLPPTAADIVNCDKIVQNRYQSQTMSNNGRITVQPPLSRRGKGPPLVLLVSDDLDLSSHSKTLDPPPLKKWAEEGYAVAQLCCHADDEPSLIQRNLKIAVGDLRKLSSCEWSGKLGVMSKLTTSSRFRT